MISSPLTRHLLSQQKTQEIAQFLADKLRPGDVILLDGPVGAGKTHFARSLIQQLLDTPEDVPSPTFTLVQTYDSAAGEIWHADLYRLSMQDEIEELGLNDAMAEAICLIEWPDRLGDYTPDDALTLSLAPQDDPDHRQLTAHWEHGKWDQKMTGFPT